MFPRSLSPIDTTYSEFALPCKGFLNIGIVDDLE